MYSRYRTYLFFTLSNGLLALGGCLGTTATAPLARDHFGRETDFGFATGYVLAFSSGLEGKEDKVYGGTGFAIAPDIVVTAGHLSFGQTDADRIVFGNSLLPTPIRTLSGIRFEIDYKPLIDGNDAVDIAKRLPGGPWIYGHLLDLKQAEKNEGDLAIIRLEKQLPDWDRRVDPTLRPEVGDIVVIGSKRGREDDRVLRVISKPIRYRLFGSNWSGLPSDLVFAESGMIRGWSGAPVKARRHSGISDDKEKWYTFGYAVRGGSCTVIVPLPEDILEYAEHHQNARSEERELTMGKP